MALPSPQSPIVPDAEMKPLSVLLETLARIDGWGPRAWREVLGGWRLPGGDLAFEEREGRPCEEGGEVVATLRFPAPKWGAARDLADATAIADWLLRQARSGLIPRLGLEAWTLEPGESVRPNNACFFHQDDLILRLSLRLPFAGMCIDGERFARAIGQFGRWSRALSSDRPGLLAQRRSIRIQQALRGALPAYGLVAFLADGSRLARDPSGGSDVDCRPLRTPRALALTIDIGRLGRFIGLGIRQGVTAIAGASYHGKTTVLAAISGGTLDRLPGDGRERVVAIPEQVMVLSDDGRPITAQDMTPFFDRLPGGEAGRFTSRRASGATSMAAAALQGIAAGGRLLLVDEDTAAANFLSLQPAMRRLLGGDLAGSRTLAEALPALAALGISSVVVAGASTAAIASADRTVLMRRFQPQDATRAARAACGRREAADDIIVPPRSLGGNPDAVLGHGHALTVEATDPERPVVRGLRLDLRRAGYDLDPWLTRGAVLGMAWACRLAEGGCDLLELGRRYEAWLAEHGPAALDPFHDGFHVVAPWPLVAAVLERNPAAALTCPAPVAAPAVRRPSSRRRISRRRP